MQDRVYHYFDRDGFHTIVDIKGGHLADISVDVSGGSMSQYHTVEASDLSTRELCEIVADLVRVAAKADAEAEKIRNARKAIADQLDLINDATTRIATSAAPVSRA